MPDRSDEFTLPRLLVCEGEEDRAFFQSLIEQNNLPRFHISTTAPKKGNAGGNTQFGNKLKSLKLNRGFGKIKKILLVTDADRDASAAFNLIKTQISHAGFLPPTSPLVASIPPSGQPSITVAIIPIGASEGHLESMCVNAAKNADTSVAAHTDHLLSQILRLQNDKHISAKAWLRVNLAVRADDPFVPLARVFSEQSNKRLIPATSTEFRVLQEELKKLG